MPGSGAADPCATLKSPYFPTPNELTRYVISCTILQKFLPSIFHKAPRPPQANPSLQTPALQHDLPRLLPASHQRPIPVRLPIPHRGRPRRERLRRVQSVRTLPIPTNLHPNGTRQNRRCHPRVALEPDPQRVTRLAAPARLLPADEDACGSVPGSVNASLKTESA